ncbi:hypothetical protein [Candidatus Electronema sp. JM]|uniref:hypothetical protein n=1 Tax=Candidatus Electronema sp. JM TaxID=3401571 RepID=UPI003AA9B028
MHFSVAVRFVIAGCGVSDVMLDMDELTFEQPFAASKKKPLKQAVANKQFVFRMITLAGLDRTAFKHGRSKQQKG